MTRRTTSRNRPQAAVLPGGPPVAVRRPLMRHSWTEITFLHWAVEPAVLQRRLPAGLTVDTFEGRAYVGVLPFTLSVGTGAGLVGARFAETNVRTYVVGPDGVPGIHFLSLDAARSDAVTVARLSHSLPYVRARMGARVVGDEVRYRSWRLWPHAAAGLSLAVGIGAPIAPADVTPLEHFLTARYALYAERRGVLRRAWVEHPPWPLRRAEVRHLDESLLVADGLPAPVGPPLALFSYGVDARVGPLEPVARSLVADVRRGRGPGEPGPGEAQRGVPSQRTDAPEVAA